jgi:hypothetical protein
VLSIWIFILKLGLKIIMLNSKKFTRESGVLKRALQLSVTEQHVQKNIERRRGRKRRWRWRKVAVSIPSQSQKLILRDENSGGTRGSCILLSAFETRALENVSRGDNSAPTHNARLSLFRAFPGGVQ